ncbi:hypothetical protein J7S78_13910 [Klebsiella oxytoca]|uniref:Uncharacterized protein n=1 Tax=Klebsiella oxytoca TaxID=571 RepID=A0AAP2BID5_KLEOX|nr:hypothetical protein [Klebsiella oxytoca]MBQ0600889.1 hypothetical protein [Klebsiella oxytoca]
MQKIPNVRKARDAIRKVGQISTPATSSIAAEALIELVRSGELLALADFVDAVLNREPDAYVKRTGLLGATPKHHVHIDFPYDGKTFPFGDYLPVFFGSMVDHE